MNMIDCRNMACPAPVISAKKALEEHGATRILLDDGAPRENVTRFAVNRGYRVEEEQQEGGWLLTITANGRGAIPAAGPERQDGALLLVGSDRLGDGPEELGRLLMKNYINTLLEIAELPDRIIFFNSGVRLTSEGSDVLEALQKLAGMGVKIFSCGLCLDFFQLRDKLRAGGVTNMLAIAEATLGAARLVRL
jgi:selenium metabolism protein YedF